MGTEVGGTKELDLGRRLLLPRLVELEDPTDPHQPLARDGILGDRGLPEATARVKPTDHLDALAAVVFDVAKRTLWLEGPCDRAVPERRMGWRLEKKLDPLVPDRPWIVSALWPGGAAERAGVRVGDRLIDVGGRAATNDVAALWAIEQQAAGTKVAVVLTRAAAKERLRFVAELRSPSLPAP